MVTTAASELQVAAQASALENTLAKAINASRISNMISSQDYNKGTATAGSGDTVQDLFGKIPHQVILNNFSGCHICERISCVSF